MQAAHGGDGVIRPQISSRDVARIPFGLREGARDSRATRASEMKNGLAQPDKFLWNFFFPSVSDSSESGEELKSRND